MGGREPWTTAAKRMNDGKGWEERRPCGGLEELATGNISYLRKKEDAKESHLVLHKCTLARKVCQ